MAQNLHKGMGRWRGRVALVTGSSVGIGAAITKQLAKEGMKVIGCARNVGQIQENARDLSKAGVMGCVIPMKCDLTKEDEIEAMFKKIRDDFGGVDVCVNNGGLANNAPLLTGTNKAWREMLQVNVLALSICTREAIKTMQERGVDDGHVVHISSLSAYRLVSAKTNMYAATKHAVKALTEGLRCELRANGSNIRVTSISPGLVASEFTNRLLDNDPKLLAQRPQIKELDTEDIVDALIYALSVPPHVQVHDILLRPLEQDV